METISSKQTYFVKRFFPAFWFGFLLLFIATGWGSGAEKELGFFIAPAIGAVFGIFLFRKWIWGLADEVRDGGSYLIVRKGGVEERVQISEVTNVSLSRFINPPQLTLKLRTSGKFGDQIVFVPKLLMFGSQSTSNYIADDLIERVSRARQQDVRR